MALDLSSIAFRVDTKELDTAVQKLGELQKAVVNLNKPIATTTAATEKLSKAQAQAAKEQSKAEEAAAKAALAQAKLEKATTSNAVAQEKLKKTTQSSSEATNSSISALERQKQILEFMTRGFSKGQSSVLTYAKTTGALTAELEELGKVLQTQRKLVGGDPFDKSTGGLQTLKNKLTEAREANRLYVAGIELTSAQTKELARDKERIIEKMKLEGASLTDIKNKLKEHNAAYLAVADSVNKLDKAERQKIQSDNASGKALTYVEREMQRAQNALAGLNENMYISTSNRLLKFKEGLVASGMATDEVAKKYQAYAKVLADTDAKRNAQLKSDEQARINNLSRGLAPQISDVAVSLYGGMSPMTVLMQQGLQVRDLIQSSGVEAGKLSEVLRKTGADFIGTIGGTFKAIGGLTVGFFQSAGQGVLDFGMKMTGANFVAQQFKQGLIDLGFSSETVSKSFSVFSNVLSGGVGIALAGTIGSFIALGFAITSVIKEENELAKSLAKSGGSLGLNLDSALQYAESMNSVGISTSKAMQVMQEMANTGKLTASDIALVTKSAVDMETYVGVSIEDTVKSFAKMRDKPVDAMIDLAKATGLVPPEIIKTIAELENQGKTAEASALAIKTLADVNSQQVQRMKEDYNGFSLFMIQLGKGISSFYDNTFKALFTKASPKAALEKQLSAVEDLLNNNAGVAGGIIGGLGIGRESYEKQRDAIKEQLSLLDKASLKEQERIANNSFLAGLQKDTEKLREGQLSKEQKYLADITVLQNKISEAKQRGATADQISVMQAEITKKSLDYQDSLNKKTKTTSGKTEENYFEKIMLEAEKATVKATDAIDELTKSQERMLVLIKDPKFLALPESKKAQALASFAAAAGQEAENKEWEAANKIMNETDKALVKARLEADKAAEARKKYGESSIESSNTRLALLDEESADLLMQKAIFGKLTDEQKKQIEYSKIQRDLTKELREIEEEVLEKKLNSSDAEVRINNAYLAAAKKRQNIDQAIILENSKVEYNERLALANSTADAIETALFEGGQAGSKKLRSILEAELRKPITLFIQAFVQDIFGLDGSNPMEKALGAVDKVMGFISGGYASGLSSAGTSAVSKLVNNEVGAKLGLSYYDGTKYTTTGLGDTIGKTAGQVGGAFTAYGLQKGLSGGYTTGESKLVDAATAIAGFFDPTGGLLAGAVGGLVNRAFGRKLTETGVQGTFGGSEGFTGSNYTFEKGGWFRSDRTKTSAMDAGMQQGFADQFNALRAGIAVMSTSLGLGTKSIEDFTYSFKLNLMGLSEADATKALSDEFNKIGVAIADTIPELNQYKTASETNLDTLTRLASSLGNVNSAFDMLGFGLNELSLAGAASASTIVEAYGGLDKFNQTMSAYYDAFYSDEEKTAQTLSNFSDVFKSVGVDVADASSLTKDGFRAIVDELVATKGAADPAVVALMGIAPAFADVADAASAAASQMQEAWASILATRDESAANAYNVQNLFDKYKATDKYGIENASDFLSISEQDFKNNYSAEQQQIIKEIIQALTPKETTRPSTGSSGSTTDRTPDTDPVQVAVDQIADALLKTRSNLEVELLRAQGKEAEALAKQKAIETQGYTTAQLALYEYNQTLQNQIDALNKAKAVAEERKGLETQLLQLQGNTVLLRQRELASLDESNRAIQQQIYALQDKIELEQNLATATDKAFAALERAVSRERESLTTQRNTAQELLSKLDNIFENLKKNVSDLYGQVDSTRKLKAQEGRSFITQALASVRTGGQFPDAAALSEAIVAARDGLDAAVYATKLEENYQRLVLANELKDLQGLAGDQRTVAELQLKAADDALEALDALLKAQRDQLDALRGIDTSVKTVAEAIAALGEAIRLEAAVRPVAPTPGGLTTPGGGLTPSGNAALISNTFQSALGRAPKAEALAHYLSTGLTGNALVSAIIDDAHRLGQTIMPSFDVGANYIPRDMVAQLHEGEMVVPKAFNPATSGINSLTSDREDMQMLRAEVRAVVQNVSKLSRTVERVIVGTNSGEAIQTTTVVA